MSPAIEQVLLTGAAGFVGRNLYPVLHRRDYRMESGAPHRRSIPRRGRAHGTRAGRLPGGIRAPGTPSRHLQSRLHTGEILRSGSVPTLELQAAMVVGGGSESWRIVRDLAARLPLMLLPVVTPRLSSYWIRLVTRADRRIAEELVEGLRSNLIVRDEGFWRLVQDHSRVPFDEAARRALVEEQRDLSRRSRIAESVIRALAPRRRSSVRG